MSKPSLTSSLFSLTTMLSILLCASCSWQRNVPQKASSEPNLIPQIASTNPSQLKSPIAKTEIWQMTVDPAQSQAKVDLMLNPTGPMGAKPSHDTCRLSGTIKLQVDTARNGQQTLTLLDVKLRNSTAMHMPFSWPFLGAISVDIPARNLRIYRHSFPHSALVSKSSRVNFQSTRFKVGGIAHVAGSGFVLSRAVGLRDVNLTIKKTEAINITGTLTKVNGVTMLHIPRAILIDSFNLSGNILDLKFTGNIYASKK